MLRGHRLDGIGPDKIWPRTWKSRTKFTFAVRSIGETFDETIMGSIMEGLVRDHRRNLGHPETWQVERYVTVKNVQNVHLSIIYILVEFSFRQGRFIALSPKTYFSVNTETDEVKSGHKGVPHVEAKKLTIDDFEECLYKGVVPNVVARELRKNNKQQIVYTETSKKGLNPIFRKFRVQSDNISCLPLTRNGKIL